MARDEVSSGGKRVGLGVASLCLVQFTDVLGVTVVVTALPRMLADLHASPDAGSLIAAGYAMFFSGLLMLGARLGDRFGHRRVIQSANGSSATPRSPWLSAVHAG